MTRIVDAQGAAAALGRAGDRLDATQRVAARREVSASTTDRLDLDRRAAVSPNGFRDRARLGIDRFAGAANTASTAPGGAPPVTFGELFG
jgi:hypothetical protein